MAMPDSLYRAKMLEEAPASEDEGRDGAKPLVLPWLGWDSKAMIEADIRNMMDSVIVAKYGSKGSEPHPMLPPGADKEPPRRENEGTEENFMRMFSKFHMT